MTSIVSVLNTDRVRQIGDKIVSYSVPIEGIYEIIGCVLYQISLQVAVSDQPELRAFSDDQTDDGLPLWHRGGL